VQSGFDASSFGGLGQRHAKNKILRTERLGQEKWEKELTWVCNALWAREKLSWTWGNATGAQRAARSVKIGIQSLQAARRGEKMSAGLEEQRIKV
jgi:hypothetical protein